MERKKRIFINASTVLLGGGVSVAINIINSLKNDFNNIEVLAVVPDTKEYQSLFKEFENIIYIPLKKLKRHNRLYTDFILINRLIKNFNPHIVFSLGNLPTPTKQYQINLFDNPFTSAKSLNNLHLTFKEKLVHKLRNIAFLRRVKYVDKFVVQTHIQQQLLLKKIKCKKDIEVLPNASINISKTEEIDFTPDKNRKYLLAFSYYYPHKNLEKLIDVARLFKQQNKNYSIVLTITNKQDKRAKKMLECIESEYLSEYIFSIGKVKASQIANLYSKVDALILPTLMESFSSTYSDSMKYEKPIFTSDRDFAHEVCGESANYFDPYNALSIYNCIELYYSLDVSLREAKLEAGKNRVANFLSWSDNLKKILKENYNG